MAGTKIDGAGAAKMQTLEEALLQLQHVHSLVERMAVMIKAQQSPGVLAQQVRRAGTPLVGLLKGQFGMISDLVANMILVAGRGGSEQMKVRSLRESVAQVRTGLEIAQSMTKKKHTVEVPGQDDENDAV